MSVHDHRRDVREPAGSEPTFRGRTALITGGHTGIGYGAARAFARAGASVMLAGRRRDVGERAAARLEEEFGSPAAFVVADVVDGEAVSAMVDACVGRFGRLDFAFNNAGVAGDLHHCIAESNIPLQRYALDVNVYGVWLCMRFQVPAILDSGGGAIVNCSSASGLRGSARTNMYAATKHAVIGMTKSVASEYANAGIRVNVVCPGLTMTDFVEDNLASVPDRVPKLLRRIPMGRIGAPEEVGDAVAWLCSDGAGYVTGAVLPIDGGTSI